MPKVVDKVLPKPKGGEKPELWPSARPNGGLKPALWPTAKPNGGEKPELWPSARPNGGESSVHKVKLVHTKNFHFLCGFLGCFLKSARRALT